MLIIKDILKNTDLIYAERKLGELCYTTPAEQRPVVKSNQIKALAEAIVNALNYELSVYRTRIKELERQVDR
jgi:hypothetical protein